MKLLRSTPGTKDIVLSTVFFAVMNAGVKYARRLPVHEAVFCRAAVTALAALILLWREKVSPWGRNKRLLVIRGLTGTAALLTYFYTLQNMPLSSAVTIQQLAPVLTILFSGVLLRERAAAVQWIFFVLAFVGVLLVKGFDPRVTALDLSVGIASSIFSGLAYNLVRMLKDEDHILVVVFYFPLVTVVVVGPYSLFHWVWPTAREGLALLVMGLSATVGHVFLTRAFHEDSAANVSIYNYLGPLYAMAIGYFAFGEGLHVWAGVGFVVILFSVVMSTRFAA